MPNTTAENLYQQLKQDILDNQFELGQVLKQEQLSCKYNVSRIPIRDVLQRLKNEAWLIQSGKCGVKINPLTADEAEDLYLMRMHLEPLLLAYAIPNINNKILGEATDILERGNNQTLTTQQHGELNWQFHTCLYQAANRQTLMSTVNNLHQSCSRYIGFHSVELDYLDTSHDEHMALIDAIKQKETKLAQSILTQHISEAGKLMVKFLESKPK